MNNRQTLFNEMAAKTYPGEPIVNTLVDEIATLRQQLAEKDVEIAYLQSKIDALMLEYCYDEMTPEQLANWAKHQKRVEES